MSVAQWFLVRGSLTDIKRSLIALGSTGCLGFSFLTYILTTERGSPPTAASWPGRVRSRQFLGQDLLAHSPYGVSSALLNRAAQSHRHDARVPALLHVAGKRPMCLCRHTWRSVLVAPSGSTPATTGLASLVLGCIDCDLRSSVCSYVLCVCGQSIC